MNWKKYLCLCTALILALLLCACGGKSDSSDDLREPPPAVEPEAPEDPEPAVSEADSELLNAMQQYLTAVRQADSYSYNDFGDNTDATGVYRYAFVPMEDGAPIPALLLEQETSFGIGYIRAFTYNPGGDAPLMAGGFLMEGVGEVGGYRGSLSMAGDGKGLLSSEFSSGTGEGTTQRITLKDGALLTETIWEGFIFDDSNPDPASEIGFVEIIWHDRPEINGAGGWKEFPSPGDFTLTASFLEANAVEEAPAATGSGGVPTDGNRIVFRGTVDTFSYDEVVKIQGAPDPNAPWDTFSQEMDYRLIVLDKPQTMALSSIDGEDEYSDGTVICIAIWDDTLPAEYDGQTHYFSIDPALTAWPTSTDLPLGQPWTGDVHVLD